MRTLVATRREHRWIFVFGFPKNERGNIDRDEEEALKKLAAHLLSLTARAVASALQAGELMEVICDAQDEIAHS
ncbi:type II toxin-antitoxin system RelE/ParE family toxin [Hydrogenophaga sp. T2]|uniref:type II toxin-antitoxin system RelE/ParE family toxin n=1 Tax=Hydrogenophaga sp. T2 TaxID=3132823 RepID=UPI003CF89A8A